MDIGFSYGDKILAFIQVLTKDRCQGLPEILTVAHVYIPQLRDPLRLSRKPNTTFFWVRERFYVSFLFLRPGHTQYIDRSWFTRLRLRQRTLYWPPSKV